MMCGEKLLLHWSGVCSLVFEIQQSQRGDLYIRQCGTTSLELRLLAPLAPLLPCSAVLNPVFMVTPHLASPLPTTSRQHVRLTIIASAQGSFFKSRIDFMSLHALANLIKREFFLVPVFIPALVGLLSLVDLLILAASCSMYPSLF